VFQHNPWSTIYTDVQSGASCRVNRQCAVEGKGYFEDRRPASNADPYQVTGIIVETVSCTLTFIIKRFLTITSSVERSASMILQPRSKRCNQVMKLKLSDLYCFDLAYFWLLTMTMNHSDESSLCPPSRHQPTILSGTPQNMYHDKRLLLAGVCYCYLACFAFCGLFIKASYLQCPCNSILLPYTTNNTNTLTLDTSQLCNFL